MHVDMNVLKALEQAWDESAAAIRGLDIASIRVAVGVGLPDSLTEQSLQTDVIGDALDVAATHFEALAALTRGTNDDYLVSESYFAKYILAVGYR